MLGTWQGLYLFEHRLEQHTRVLSTSFDWRLIYEKAWFWKKSELVEQH